MDLWLDMCVWSVAQSCPTPCDPRNYSPPESFVHGIFQARILDRVLLFPRGSSWPRDRTWIEPASLSSSALAGSFFTTAPPGKTHGCMRACWSRLALTQMSCFCSKWLYSIPSPTISGSIQAVCLFFCLFLRQCQKHKKERRNILGLLRSRLRTGTTLLLPYSIGQSIDFYFLQKFQMHINTEQKVQSSRRPPSPTHANNFSISSIPVTSSGTFVAIDGQTLTHHYHQKFIIFIRIYSWFCTFSEFRQMCNEVSPSLQCCAGSPTAFQVLLLCALFLPLSYPLARPGLFADSIVLSFPACRVVGITQFQLKSFLTYKSAHFPYTLFSLIRRNKH